MLRGTLVLPSSLPVARRMLEEIGRLSVVQFVDMQANALNRPYNTYIQRIDEMERIIRFLLEEIHGLELAAAGADGEVTPLVMRAAEGEKSFLENGKGYILDKVEEALTRLYAQFVRFKSNNMNLTDEKNAALEERHVMQVAMAQLRGGAALDAAGHLGSARSEAALVGASEDSSEKLLGQAEMAAFEGEENSAHLRFERTSTEGGAVAAVAGVISSADIPGFQRAVFRVTRGNAFTFFQSLPQTAPPEAGGGDAPERRRLQGRQAKQGAASSAGREVQQPSGGGPEKSVFVVYHQGSAKSLLHQKIAKVCDAFGGRVYEWPTSAHQAEKRLTGSKNSREPTAGCMDTAAYSLRHLLTYRCLWRPGMRRVEFFDRRQGEDAGGLRRIFPRRNFNPARSRSPRRFFSDRGVADVLSEREGHLLDA